MTPNTAPTPATPALPLAAAGLMLISVSIVPMADVFGKLLTSGQSGGAVVAPVFVAWARFAGGALLLAPFMRGGGLTLAILTDWRIWLRGLLVTGSISMILTALKTVDISTVFAAFFIGPILSYFMSALFLGERLSWARTALMGLGLAGVLLVVRPGFGAPPGAGFALLAGAFYGGYLVASRWLGGYARPRAMLFSQLVIGSIALLPAAAITVPPAGVTVVALLMGSAAASMLGNLCLIFAYRRAEASRLAPFVYGQLVAATIYGALFFGERPDALAVLGLCAIIASGLGAVMLRRGR